MKFNTVLLNLRSAKNVGMIARSHLAFGGDLLILIGDENKWNFKGGTSTYTRKLIESEKLLFFKNFKEFRKWNINHLNFKNLAIEVAENAVKSHQYNYPENCNVILGNERTGIPTEIIKECDLAITIPQITPIGSLNVAISASILFYEISQRMKAKTSIENYKFT